MQELDVVRVDELAHGSEAICQAQNGYLGGVLTEETYVPDVWRLRRSGTIYVCAQITNLAVAACLTSRWIWR